MLCGRSLQLWPTRWYQEEHLRVLFPSAGTLTHSCNYSSQFTQTILSLQKNCRKEVAREWGTQCHSLEACKAPAGRVPTLLSQVYTMPEHRVVGAQEDIRGVISKLEPLSMTAPGFLHHPHWGSVLELRKYAIFFSSFLLLKSNSIGSHWPKQKLGIWQFHIKLR